MTLDVAGARVVVVGFGTSGRAAATVLAERGADVLVSETRDERVGGEDVPRGVDVAWGGHRREHLDGATLVVVSPGVPEHAPVVRWAIDAGVPVWSELELGARLCRVPYVAITGTNGKTTTTELVAAVMREGGLRAKACGNVGHPFSLAAGEEDVDALAVEASSFQLRFQESLHPKVSVLLNLAPDHLDWHGSFDAYAAAKARVYVAQDEGDVHVGNRDDPEAARLSRMAPCRVRWFGWGQPLPRDAGIVDGRIVVDGDTVADVPPTASPAFAEDAAAAALAAISFGCPPSAVARAVTAFEPLPHRGALVGEVDVVRFVDDSKATNPHAALAAIRGVTDAVLIAGGLAKGVDLSPLAGAADRLVAVVAIGEAAPQLEAVFAGLVPVARAASIEDAVRAASELAPPGGTVLLAPACASQDMFRDYRERGDRFAAAVAALEREPRRSHA